MAVLGWIALGLATALTRSGFRHYGERRHELAAGCAIAMAGALLTGLVAVGAGVGSIGDFFHTGTWLIAFGGSALALVGSELASDPSGRGEITGARSRFWAGHAGGESERLHRNW